jgi:hypothetical protein
MLGDGHRVHETGDLAGDDGAQQEVVVEDGAEDVVLLGRLAGDDGAQQEVVVEDGAEDVVPPWQACRR